MLETAKITINRGESYTTNLKLWDSTSGTPTIIPAEDITSVTVEVRFSPDRSTKIITTLNPSRVGDNYVIILPASITEDYTGDLYGDIKVVYATGLIRYVTRLQYEIDNTTTE